MLVGSLAKDTDIRGTKDVDMFILFPVDMKREELEKQGLAIAKELFEEMNLTYEIDYAEHPYVIGRYNKEYTIEIVPCYDTPIKKSAVDRTPYHTKYVRAKLRKNPELKNEIRLLKQFMKGAGVYGAEAKSMGFSGYLAELLVINYGSFESVIKESLEWKFGECIDPEKSWKDKKLLKYFFVDADFVVVDPTDENRNVAAAVSRQKLAEFIVACRKFIENPSEEFFFPKERKVPGKEKILEKLHKRGTKVIGILFLHEKINPNSLYSQLRKTEDSVKSSIEQYNFKILKSGFWTNELDKSIILYEFEVWKLPKFERRFGPRVDMHVKNQDDFLNKHKNEKIYLENGIWATDTERKFTDVLKLIEVIIGEKKGFGKYIKESGKVEILADDELLGLEDEGFLRFLGEFF
jgi:tRNA nucleotidyltransferase (CCA-adding enzyme)